MNSILIQSAKQLQSQLTDEPADLFGYAIQPAVPYMPTILHIDPSNTESDKGYVTYSYHINDKLINAITDLCLSFETPELFSDKQIAFSCFLGFKLIKSVSIYDKDQKIITVTGKTLFSRAHAARLNLETSGHSKELCNFNLSYMENLNSQKKYYLPASKIHVPLIMFNPGFETFTNIKNLPASKLRIEVCMLEDLTKVMVYNPGAEFMYAFDRPVKDDILKIKKPVISATAFAIVNNRTNASDNYIISTHESTGGIEEDEHSVPNLDNLTHVNYGIENDLSGKRFVCWAGYDQSEDNWVNTYITKLLPEIIKILPEDVLPTDNPDTSEKAVYVQVVNNEICVNNIKTIQINIERVPKNYKIWLHTNPLSFRADKTQMIYNVIEKINSIHCSWNLNKGNFEIYDVNHQIDIGDVSIPVEIWDVKTKSNEGDNRSAANRATDVIINDPFLMGIDLLNKQNVIDVVTVKHGSETLYESRLDVCNYYPHHNSRLSFPFLRKGYGNLSFCYHSDMVLFPNYMPSDHARGRSQIGINVVYSKYNKQDPRYHIGKKLSIQYGVVSLVRGVTGQNMVSAMNHVQN